MIQSVLLPFFKWLKIKDVIYERYILNQIVNFILYSVMNFYVKLFEAIIKRFKVYFYDVLPELNIRS